MGKLAILYGGIAGMGATSSALSLVNYATQQFSVVQEHFSKGPELTDVIESINNAAETGEGGGMVLSALAFGTVAGVFAGLTLYEAAKTRRE